MWLETVYYISWVFPTKNFLAVVNPTDVHPSNEIAFIQPIKWEKNVPKFYGFNRKAEVMEETGKYNKEQLKNHQNLWLEQAVYKFEWEK